MSLPRYPAYKPSGVQWLGEVPEYWSVNRFKLSVDSCTNGVWGEEASNDENDVTCIRVADFDRPRLEAKDPDEPTIRNVNVRDIKQRSLRKGDLLIEKSGGGEKQPVGAVVLYMGTIPAVCSNFVARMRLKRCQSPSFWRYTHHAAYSLRINTKSIKQTSGIQNLDQQQYLDESAAYPTFDEQLAIASFLDRETTKIDALIAEQKRLIELLQEKRQAVISHAVTKGLNPNAPMKDSGVEWLGDVPEHWITGKLCYYARLDTGSTPDRQRPEYWNGDIPWVKTGEVRYEDIYETEEKITELALQETSCSLQQPGTLLMALYGQGVTRGRVGMLMTAASCNQACAAITSSTSINERFLELYLTNAYPHVRSLGNETTQQNLNLDFVGKLELLVPPLAEQECIWQATKQRTKELDALFLQSEDVIVLLQERRSALISAAVTGQIDVRGLVEAEGGDQ